jgi:hypothetical protein
MFLQMGRRTIERASGLTAPNLPVYPLTRECEARHLRVQESRASSVSTTATTSNADGSGLIRNIGAGGWIVDNFGVQLGVVNNSAAWAALEAAAGVNPANVTYLEQVAVLQTAILAKVYGATSASISG